MLKKYKDKELRIMIIVKCVDGGTGKFVEDFQKISTLFTDRKIKIKTLILEKPSFKPLTGFDYFCFRGEDYYPPSFSLATKSFVEFLEELLWTIKNIIKYKPHIIVGIEMRPNFLAIISKILCLGKFKVITTTHIDLAAMITNKRTGNMNVFLKHAIHHLYNKADVVVGVSQSLSKSIKNTFRLSRKVITIYNGIEINKSRKRTGPHVNKKIITMVGRLVDQKDHQNLIKAFNILQNKISNSELWIIGDGPIREQLESIVKKFNLTKKIVFWGRVPKIEKYLMKSDLFAFSSKREGFAYVLVEAMQQGLPVISTDTPYGPREVLGNGKFGVLVPVGKPDKMQEAIYTLLTNRKKYEYYSTKSLERCENFSIDVMLNKYKSLILKVLK